MPDKLAAFLISLDKADAQEVYDFLCTHDNMTVVIRMLDQLDGFKTSPLYDPQAACRWADRKGK